MERPTKRAGNLFDAVVDRDRLREAFRRACIGKRDRAEVRAFAANLDINLAHIGDQLRAGKLPLGRFTQFVIHDPKERLITAPCFEERVVHHAVVGACEPAFERWLIPDTFACRVGRGRDAALRRAGEFARRYPRFLKMDIRKYFDSIPHDRLLSRLERRFKDRRLLDLFARIVGSYSASPGRGLPVGSLTSQHFANFYLGWFDRVVKEQWRVGGYVRYMDDMALWAEDSGETRRLEAAAATWLGDELGLALKSEPYRNRTTAGMDFLGFRVFPDRLTLNRRSRVRFRRRLVVLDRKHEAGEIGEGEYRQRGTALVAYAAAVGVSSWRTRRAVVDQSWELVERLEPSEPGRELEQQRQELPRGVPEQEHAGQPEQQPRLPTGRSSAGRVDS